MLSPQHTAPGGNQNDQTQDHRVWAYGCGALMMPKPRHAMKTEKVYCHAGATLSRKPQRDPAGMTGDEMMVSLC